MSRAAPSSAAHLRQHAEGLAGPLPPLLAEAEQLAASILLGEHGRRRAGLGDAFWQFRAAQPGDSLRDIDWRRSAMSDAHFIRQSEWQAAQSVSFWVDTAASMGFSGAQSRAPKRHRARLLALAAAVLLTRAGERVGLAGGAEPTRTGNAHLARFAARLCAPSGSGDYGEPELGRVPAGGRAVFISDFLGDLAPLKAALARAADRGVKGALMQVLDPAEESFPYRGRTRFESMSGTVRFETLRAGALRAAYGARLEARKAALADLAHRTGWQAHCTHTGKPAGAALLWLYRALERRR